MKPQRFLTLLLTTAFLLASSCGTPPGGGSPEGGSSEPLGAPEQSEAAAAGTTATETAAEETTSAPEATAEKTVEKGAAGGRAVKGKSKPKREPAPAEKVVEANIRGLKYLPGPITVSPGTTVRWINEDRALHTVTSEDSGGPLRSKELEDGESYEYTFRKLGQYDYYCTVHPFMKSGVTVE